MSPTTQDQVLNHLEFLGYEVERQDYGVSAKHTTLPNVIARLYNEGIVLSTYYITTDSAKANRQRVLDFVNSLNQRTLAIRYFVDDDFDLSLAAFFPSD